MAQCLRAMNIPEFNGWMFYLNRNKYLFIIQFPADALAMCIELINTKSLFKYNISNCLLNCTCTNTTLPVPTNSFIINQ